MILLEVVDAERSKDAAAQDDRDNAVTRRNSISSQPPPPPFQRAESPAPTYASSRTDVTENPGLAKQAPAFIVRRPRSIWKIVALSFVVYVVISAIIAIPAYIVFRRKDRGLTSTYPRDWEALNLAPPPPLGSPSPESTLLPIISNEPVQCNSWTVLDDHNWVYGLSYQLPLSGTIYLSSNISDHNNSVPISTGRLHMSVSNNAELEDALVNITFAGARRGDSAAVRACVVRTDTGWGVAISVPDDGQQRYFDLNLTLPSPTDGSQLTGLATYLPTFNQSIDQLNAYPEFDTFILYGSLGSVHVESVQARSIIVKTSGAGITGSFNSSGVVDLKTILAPVKANVFLRNDGNEFSPSYLGVHTGNSSITLNCTLYGTSDQNGRSRPKFSGRLATFGGALEAAIWHDQNLTSSSLYLHAHNSLNSTSVFVDSKFEGMYDVQTSLADAVLDRSMQLADPTGAGRQRSFVDNEVFPSHISGLVGWGTTAQPAVSWPGPGAFGQGYVFVESSMAPAVLQLTDSPDPSLFSDLYH